MAGPTTKLSPPPNKKHDGLPCGAGAGHGRRARLLWGRSPSPSITSRGRPCPCGSCGYRPGVSGAAPGVGERRRDRRSRRIEGGGPHHRRPYDQHCRRRPPCEVHGWSWSIVVAVAAGGQRPQRCLPGSHRCYGEVLGEIENAAHQLGGQRPCRPVISELRTSGRRP